MPLLKADELRDLSIKIFERLGASREEAEIVSNHLVESNLMGHDSHGVVRIPEYVGRIIGKPILKVDAPPIKLKANIRVIKDSLTTALIDGDWGFGQVVAKKAMEIAIKKAKEYNVGLVAAKNCDHVGRVGDFTLMAAEQDMIGMMFVKTVPVMAPVGGKGKVLGNNPISIAVPSSGKPLLLDFAMSVVAGGKIIVAAEKGEKIPEGWIINSEGKPSNNPRDYLDGGALLPFAGHKGYALSVMMEVLGGLLAGVGGLKDYIGINSFLAMAINVEAFLPLKEFKDKVDKLIRDIKSAEKVNGVDEIFLPGEMEFRSKERKLKEGIYIPDKTWKDIVEIAKKLNIF